MSDKSKRSAPQMTSRRDFLKKSSILVAGGAVAGPLSIARAAHSYGSDTIKIGLIGCGGRGTGAAGQAMNTKGGGVRLIAMADVFADKVQASYRGLKSQYADQVDVPKDRQFFGFDGYKGVLECDIDLVILAEPPGFRPKSFAAAVKAGKHVFAEKPLGVDGAGVRKILAANEEAKSKGLLVQVGLQRHHEEAYRETIKRLQEGAIGDVLFSRVYWNMGPLWIRQRQPSQTEMEYQMRNWYYFTWLSGDHIVEQHIHNLDVVNWLKGAYPVEANGMGGRQVRTDKETGQIYDHHFVEFTYADGSKMFSQCRQIQGCWPNVSEHAHGTKGWVDISGAKIYSANGNLAWSYGKGGRDGHQQEHHDLFADLRAGRLPNEVEYGAMSTMTAILGRLCTYSGKVITMEEALKSDVAISPVDQYTSMNDAPPVVPDADGNYHVAVPGEEKVV